MSVAITDAMPTGTGAIVNGCNLDLGIEHAVGPVNIDIGTGTVTACGPHAFAANGAYSFNVFGHGGSGTWSLSIQSTDGGNSYTASYAITGTWNGRADNVPVAPVQSGQGTDTVITWSAGGFSVVQSFQNDSPVQKAKVYLTFALDGTERTMYLYNTSYYGS